MQLRILLTVVSIAMTFQFGMAQQSVLDEKVSSPELAAIRSQAKAFVEAFDGQDAKAVASFWTADGEYVDDAGQVYEGREAIESCYANLFASSPDAKLQVVSDSIRLPSSGLAIEDGRTKVDFESNGTAAISSYTAVHVQVDGKWLIASVRETLADPSAAESGVSDLEFLIGNWIAEENGVRNETECKWICDKRFVQRTYTSTHLDGSSSSGLQIIGWNPRSNSVYSWDFNSAGGLAVGGWVATDGGWLAKVNGISADGVSTTSINILRRLDDNAYVWQSIDRVFGDVFLPDTGEVIIRRKPVAQ